MFTPQVPFYYNAHSSPTSEYVLPALRELLAACPQAADCSTQKMGELLYELHYTSVPLETHQVEAALEALRVEGEILA